MKQYIGQQCLLSSGCPPKVGGNILTILRYFQAYVKLIKLIRQGLQPAIYGIANHGLFVIGCFLLLAVLLPSQKIN